TAGPVVEWVDVRRLREEIADAREREQQAKSRGKNELLPGRNVELVERISQSEKNRHQVERAKVHGADVAEMPAQRGLRRQVDDGPQDAGHHDGGKVKRRQNEVQALHRSPPLEEVVQEWTGSHGALRHGH